MLGTLNLETLKLTPVEGKKIGAETRPRLQPLARAPHPNLGERLRRIVHRHATHNRFLARFRQVTGAHFVFRNEDLPRKREEIMESFTDDLRVVTHDWFHLIG
ncbi:MAG: hypothetical protein OXI66_09505 [Boseongicola sp.]|nr:hypothetical protein [Boseongicola sp.]MXW85835.1 hypothetical protein [Boseongicola sp. SB0667_bin_21]